MNLTEHEYYMEKALQEANSAFFRGEFPVGCVIVQKGNIIASGSRTGTSMRGCRPSEIDHAEIRALKNAEILGNVFVPEQALLYCTMEPCLMCFGAIVLSGIKYIVYGYEDVMGGGTSCNFTTMPVLYRDSNVKIVPGVLRSASLKLFEQFFINKDNLYWKNSLLERYTLEQAAICSQTKKSCN